jgi:hypothetical protein
VGVRAIAKSLACGNTVVLKTFELFPRAQCLMSQVLHGAGFPDGVVNVVTSSDEPHTALRQCGRPLRTAAPPVLQRGTATATGSYAAGKSPQLPSLLSIRDGLAPALLTVLVPPYAD